MISTTNSTLIAKIHQLSHEGRGIASIDGKVTFLRGGLPGETVEFHYLKRHSQFDEGQVTSVLEASSLRTLPVCQHFNVCGGCSLQHLKTDAQIILKQEQLLAQLTHLGL